MPNPKLVSPEEHAIIQRKCIKDPATEDYVVVVQKAKGFWQKTIHVFHRQPTQKELQTYEETSSKVKFRGSKAEMEGAPLQAASSLYDKIIERAFDVWVGLQKHEQMDAATARAKVLPTMKREAIRELVAEVYSASRMEEAEGHVEAAESSVTDDEKEEHTRSATAGV